MPGFLGGSTGGSTGTGGEISFPKEFVDPVTKLRVSQPENLIDTDFEYGLQPTKWETVELINNTPSFFSKSGDTTIPNILSITTNAGTREITVVTASAHEVSSGIPIQVTGTKSVTADGSYIVNSTPNPTTFTYLCRANQSATSSIEDLYSSIITGEFFQGSQLRIADASGIVTSDEAISILTVTTDSAHGFKTGTPFYFLNLNSTISQEFQSNNSAAKSFDSTNSAIAQTFDGSNTLSSINIDWSNSATVGGVTSTVSAVNTIENTITVAHGTENFENQPIGTPLYYAITGGAGYFADNPRGVIFLNSTDALGTSSSTFQVSAVPDGNVIPITASISGTFQLANQARTFAGNNVDPETEIPLTVIVGEDIAFDGGNQGYVGEAALETAPNGVCTVLGYTSESILVNTTTGAGLDYYVGAMVRYTTTGSAASGLTNNTTYFIAEFSASSGDLYNIRLKALPNDTAFLAPSGGSGTQRFTKIGVSVDKDIVHIKDSNFDRNEMLQYTSPVDGGFEANYEQKFYFVDVAYDTHNYRLTESTFLPIIATGGTIFPTAYADGRFYQIHAFTSVGSNTFEVQSAPTGSSVEYLIVAGGGGGGMDMGGGGGGGGVLSGTTSVSIGSYPIVVGAGGTGAPRAGFGAGTQNADRHLFTVPGTNGGNSSAFGLTAIGGGRGGLSYWTASAGQVLARGQLGGSGGGASGYDTPSGQGRGEGTAGQGNPGGNGSGSYWSGGGGGAGGSGGQGSFGGAPFGGPGVPNAILGTNYFWGGGGGGAGYSSTGGNGGIGGGGGGAVGGPTSGGVGLNNGQSGGGGPANAWANTPGGNGGANTGGGGGGGAHYTANNQGGNGGSGIVVVRYPITPVPTGDYPIATGGTVSTLTVGEDIYAVHRFTNLGAQSFVVTSSGSETLGSNTLELLVVGGGGGGGFDMGGGGGGGSVIAGTAVATAGTYTINVGDGGYGAGANQGGNGNGHQYGRGSVNGQDSTVVGPGSALNLRAKGGGFGGSSYWDYSPGANGAAGGNGGGASGYSNGQGPGGRVGGGTTQAAQGLRTGLATITSGDTGFTGGRGGGQYFSGGGAGAGGRGVDSTARADGGPGVPNAILGTNYFWGGGGGGSGHDRAAGNGGSGGGGGGASNNTGGGNLGDTTGLNPAGNGLVRGNAPAGNGGTNTGGGGGGSAHYNGDTKGGNGGSGIVVIRYKIGTVN
jgi:hypothetical protein